MNIYVQVNKLYKTWKSVYENLEKAPVKTPVEVSIESTERNCEKLEKDPAFMPAEYSMVSGQSTRFLKTPEIAAVD